jgi:hypothetical protein
MGVIVGPLLGVICGFRAESGGCFGPCSAQDRGAILQSALRDLAAGFQYDELFAGDESEHGIRRGLGVFDEVAVNGERAAIEACQFDHACVPPGFLSARKLLSIGEIDGGLMKIGQKWNSCKVCGAEADEVGERGASA